MIQLVKEHTRGYSEPITNSHQVFNELKDIKDETKEVFIVFYLDTKNRIIAREIVHIGTLNASLVHPREIFRGAILRNCNSIIVAHNHPSGDVTPSNEDLEINEMLKKAGELLHIKLLDNIIVGTAMFKSIIGD